MPAGKNKSRTSPSFTGLRPASEASSRAKRANRCQNTRAEVLLRSALWGMGLRFRKNLPELPGKPDIVFPRSRVVVFCDGDFWHGRNWRALRAKLKQGTNSDYWVRKIAANMARDQTTDEVLRANGWLVIRFWATDVLADPGRAASAVRRVLTSRCRKALSRKCGQRCLSRPDARLQITGNSRTV